MNNIINTGKYVVVSPIAHGPGSEAFTLDVISTDVDNGAWCTQTATFFSEHIIKFRTNSGSGWSDWEQATVASDLTQKQVSMSITPLNDAELTGTAWGYRSGNILAGSFDITFAVMGTETVKLRFGNIPEDAWCTPVSGTFGQKPITANVRNGGELSLYSDYGIGRYLGFFICFL